MKKLLAMFLCALMLLTSAAAVAEGANIVWAGWSGEEEATKDIFQKMMDTYEAETGNTVTWVGWTWADTAQQLLIRVQGGEPWPRRACSPTGPRFWARITSRRTSRKPRWPPAALTASSSACPGPWPPSAWFTTPSCSPPPAGTPCL